MNADPYRIEVGLWIRDGQMAAFQDYETVANDVMAELGARVVEVRTPLRSSDADPTEVHVVHYPSKAAFDAYLAHPKLLAVADLRASCVARTDVKVIE